MRGGVHDGVKDVGKRVLGAVAHENLRGRVVQAVFALEFVADRLAQRERAGGGRVARHTVIQRVLGGIADVFGRIKIGFASAEADHIQPLLLHFLGLGIDRQRQRSRNGGNASG